MTGRRERDETVESIISLYFEALSASSFRAFYHGVWSSVFHQGITWDFANIQCALRGQPVCAADCWNSNDYYALCIHCHADPDSEERLSSDPVNAASGCIFLRLSDGFWAVQGISYDTYWQQWIICIIGIFLVAVGVSLEVKAGVVVLAGEGVVLAICKVLPVKFGYMKVGFDVTLVVVACLLSVVFTGQLQGVREGTVAAAIFVGLIAKRIGKILERWDLEKE